MTDAEITIKEIAGEIANKRGYTPYDFKLRPVTTNGANFTSGLFALTISCVDKPDINGFAKVVMVGEKIRENSPMEDIFKKESFFYTNLAEKFKELEKKYDCLEEDRLRLPIYYGQNKEKETLVLEDLTASGFKLQERRECYSWEYAKAAVTQMAKFHALCLAYGEEHPEEYDQLCKNLEFTFPLDNEDMDNYWAMVIKGVFDSVKQENHESLKKFVETRLTKEELMKVYKPIRRPVIVHGDYRMSNLMHRVKENGEYEVVPVDFQTIHIGCPLLDLFYFIYSGSDAEFRETHMTTLIQHYYTQLCDHLARLGQDAEQLYSKEDFKYELDQTKYYGMMLSIFILKIVTVEPEDVPTVDKSMDFQSFDVKASDLYERRINEVVDEYVKLGLL